MTVLYMHTSIMIRRAHDFRAGYPFGYEGRVASKQSHGSGSRAFQLPSTSSDCSLTLDALNDEGRANDALLDALDGELALCALLSLQTA